MLFACGIRGGQGRPLERRNALVCHHADDREHIVPGRPGRLQRRTPEQDLTADRVGPLEKLPRHRLVDDQDERRTVAVVGGQDAAIDQP
jgi:hypothetical protein